MIINCPNCATRYDVDDSRIAGDGRAVRCAVCDTSWFVPAPEPIANLIRPSADADAPARAQTPPAEEDDALFETVDPDAAPAATAREQSLADESGGNFFQRFRGRESDRDGAQEDGWRDRAREPESARLAAEETPDDARDAVVDAAFEDVDEDGEFVERRRGFGRRLRDRRRRTTALAPIDDLDAAADRVFSDEFFAALHVQPRELERAIRKARRRADARNKNRLTPWRALGWSVWIGAVAACLFVAYVYRQDIVDAWPNAQAAYAVIGVDAEPHGLKISKVAHRFATSTLGPSLEVTGEIFNDSDEPMVAPLLQAEAFDAQGALLARWTFEAETENLAPGAKADFATRSAAPAGVAEIAISFAPESPRPRIGPGLAGE